MKRYKLACQLIAGTACFLGFLTISVGLSRSQSERPDIRPVWIPQKEILLSGVMPIQSESLYLEVEEFVVKEPPRLIHEKISTQELTRHIPKATISAKAREKKKFDSLNLLTDGELQAMVNYLDYEIFPGKGVRFHYSDVPDTPIGHMWFLKKPHDLRGKTVRLDYRGYAPEWINVKMARSGTSASVTRKVKLENAPHESKSIFLETPNKFPFKDVKYFEFWIDRESASRSYGDFVIERVAVLPFVPTNLTRSNEVDPFSPLNTAQTQEGIRP